MKQKPIHPSMQPYLDGKVLLIDKPLHWTSFDVIRKLRKWTGVNKIGHAGTLDPLATGLLIICTGKYTKSINDYMAQTKEYIGTITIGAITPTYDLESTPEQQKDFAHITEAEIVQATNHFVGDIQQLPPIHSAIKQGGKPVYLAARKGEEVVLEPRNIKIYEFDITNIALPNIAFRVRCSTGTYIRSLANDFGALLGTGGYLSQLRRTKIGDFDAENAYNVTSLEKEIEDLKLSAIN